MTKYIAKRYPHTYADEIGGGTTLCNFILQEKHDWLHKKGILALKKA